MPHPIPAPSHRNNTFYSSMAVLFAISVFVGFSRTYYLRTLFGGPHLPSLTHIHGAVFTLWTLFFLFQALLVSSGRIGAHRRLGWMGAVFAVGIVILGTAMTFHSMQAAQASGGPVMGLRLINGVIDLLLFCGFFGFALLLRRRREIHKRLMMLAMISLIIPALGRFPVPSNLIPWVICVFSLTGVVYDVLFLRHLYPVSVIGVVLINLGSPLRFIMADAQWWQRFAQWLTG